MEERRGPNLPAQQWLVLLALLSWADVVDEMWTPSSGTKATVILRSVSRRARTKTRWTQKNCVSKYRKLKGKAGEKGKENWNKCSIWQVLFQKILCLQETGIFTQDFRQTVNNCNCLVTCIVKPLIFHSFHSPAKAPLDLTHYDICWAALSTSPA